MIFEGTGDNGPVKCMWNTSWRSTTTDMVEIQDFFIHIKQI